MALTPEQQANNDRLKQEHEQWAQERKNDPVTEVVVEKRIFEMDIEPTVHRIRDGRIKHSLDELRQMTAYEQLKAGAYGFTDLAETRDPDEICTYVVETLESDHEHPDRPPRRQTVEDYPSAEEAFDHAEKLAQYHNVSIIDRSQTDHHVIVGGDSGMMLFDRAFNLSEAEKLLAYYVGHGEDAYLADNRSHDTLKPFGWRAQP